jgi:hypothetical protein
MQFFLPLDYLSSSFLGRSFTFRDLLSVHPQDVFFPRGKTHRVTWRKSYGMYWGRAVAQAVSWWLPATEARACHVGFVVDKAAEYFGFPCQSFHWLLYTNHYRSSWAGTIRQTVADVPSGLNLIAKNYGMYSVGVYLQCCRDIRYPVLVVSWFFLVLPDKYGNVA